MQQKLTTIYCIYCIDSLYSLYSIYSIYSIWCIDSIPSYFDVVNCAKFKFSNDCKNQTVLWIGLIFRNQGDFYLPINRPFIRFCPKKITNLSNLQLKIGNFQHLVKHGLDFTATNVNVLLPIFYCKLLKFVKFFGQKCI